MPEEKHRDDVLEFYNEFERNGESCIGYGNYRDFDAWLIGMGSRRTGKNLPEGYVRENFYLCYEGGEMVGVFSLKFELTQFLLDFGGHIGYAVRAKRRKRGLATRMLKQGLDIARELGFEKVLLVCDDDNLASERVIIKNGGAYENRLFDPDEGVYVKRYWIAL